MLNKVPVLHYTYDNQVPLFLKDLQTSVRANYSVIVEVPFLIIHEL